MSKIRRRRRKAVAVGDLSFFSFQDIITSVTGILLLLTLIMATSITRRPAQAAPVPETAEITTADRAADHDARQSAMAVHAAAASKRAETVRLSAGMDAVHAMLDVTDAGDRAGGIERVLDSLPELLRASAGRIADGKARMVALDDRLKALRAKAVAAEREEHTFTEQAKTAAKELSFLPGRQDATPVLAEMDRVGVRVGTLDRDGRPHRTDSAAAGREIDAIAAAAARLRRAAVAVVLLVRPDAVDRVHDVAEAVRRRGMTVGWDVAPSGPVFPEQGADRGTP